MITPLTGYHFPSNDHTTFLVDEQLPTPGSQKKTHTDSLNQSTAHGMLPSSIILLHWYFVHNHDLPLLNYYSIPHSSGSIVASFTPTIRVRGQPVPLASQYHVSHLRSACIVRSTNTPYQSIVCCLRRTLSPVNSLRPFVVTVIPMQHISA